MLEVLGEGGMGTVYRAIHTRLERLVAVKVMRRGRWSDPASLSRFEREMRAVGRLRHPNIVHATDAGEADGIPYLVMELVDGRNLTRVVKEDGPLPLAEACEAARQAAIGLQHAHEAGLIHRDVKPSNLIRTPDGTVKLLDLGLAMMTAGPLDPETGGASSPTQTDGSRTSRAVGTLEYMAPEQRRDSRGVDARADIYGLGCTLYSLLTGKAPRADGVVGEYPTGLPAELWRKFLANDPAERFPSAAAAADALVPFTDPAGPRVERRLSRRAWLTIAGGAAVAAVGAAVVFRPRPESESPSGPPVGKLPMTLEEARDLQKRWAKHLNRPVTFDGPHGMKFILIPPGELGLSTECRVRITRPYYLATCEVTVGQFRAFVKAKSYRTEAETNGEGGYYFDAMARKDHFQHGPQYTWRTPGHPIVTDNHPVTQVSWRDADEFCEWLSRTQPGMYCLPTEAEWVWAARAGSTDMSIHKASDPSLHKVAWLRPNSGKPPQTQKVGQLKPNPWGLFDTIGNMAEICLDFHGDLPIGTFDDYKGPTSHVHGWHVIQGCPYYSVAAQLCTRSCLKSCCAEVGFRVCRTID